MAAAAHEFMIPAAWADEAVARAAAEMRAAGVDVDSPWFLRELARARARIDQVKIVLTFRIAPQGKA